MARSGPYILIQIQYIPHKNRTLVRERPYQSWNISKKKLIYQLVSSCCCVCPQVSDEDEGRNAAVLLKIVGGNKDGVFRVDPVSGTLYTARPLDAETKQRYTLTVAAVDQASVGSRRQSSARVRVTVKDVNDNDPRLVPQIDPSVKLYNHGEGPY